MKNLSKQSIAIIGQKGIPKEFPGTSGVEFYVEKKALKFKKRGNAVRCYVRNWANPHNLQEFKGIELITVKTIHTKFLDTIIYSFIASIHASRRDNTIVWYHGIGPGFFSFIPKISGKKVYTTIHSLDWKRKKWNFFAKYFLKACEYISVKNADVLFVVSENLKEYYNKNYYVNAHLDKYEEVRKKRVDPSIIKKYNLKKNKYILYLGRFVPEKRIEWLIDAYKEGSQLPLVIAGGSSHTDEYEKHLKLISEGYKIIFTGYIFGKEKEELLSNCKALILPSSLEGFPVIIAEALAYRKNCLLSDALQFEYKQEKKHLTFFEEKSYASFLKSFKKIIS